MHTVLSWLIACLPDKKSACVASAGMASQRRNHHPVQSINVLSRSALRFSNRRNGQHHTHDEPGIKAKVKSPDYVKAMSAAVQSRLREREQGADKKLFTAELGKVDRELQNASRACWM